MSEIRVKDANGETATMTADELAELAPHPYQWLAVIKMLITGEPSQITLVGDDGAKHRVEVCLA
jgi:hypothetical protein